jgi:hypothetical protein
LGLSLKELTINLHQLKTVKTYKNSENNEKRICKVRPIFYSAFSSIRNKGKKAGGRCIAETKYIFPEFFCDKYFIHITKIAGKGAGSKIYIYLEKGLQYKIILVEDLQYFYKY